MTKILSKVTKEESQLQTLRDMIEVVTDGAIAKGAAIAPGKDLEELVTQIDLVFSTLLDAIELLEFEAILLSEGMSDLEDALTDRDSLINALETVSFDEDLDHATTDFMDALLGAGIAESTLDGEISFPSKVTFRKSDLKPYVKHAIQEWVSLKFR